MNSPIVVTVANDSYALALAVMLKSLETNLNPGITAKVYILNKDLDKKIIREIERTIVLEKLQLEWVEICHTGLIGLKVDGHITIDTYYRLLIEELFPQYSKIIYLDADLIINGCISEIWNTDIGSNHLAAIPLASKKSGIFGGERGIPAYKLLGIPGETRTFNAGVMMLNLKLWREDAISNQIVKYIREYYEYVLWWDQDGLNTILHNKWFVLHPAWNVMTCHLFSASSWHDLLLTEREYRLVWQLPKIIHYAGPSKPWLPNYEGPFQDIFLQYVYNLSSDYLISLNLSENKKVS